MTARRTEFVVVVSAQDGTLWVASRSRTLQSALAIVSNWASLRRRARIYRREVRS